MWVCINSFLTVALWLGAWRDCSTRYFKQSQKLKRGRYSSIILLGVDDLLKEQK
nr:hypothetical protein [uncultured bacterium]